MAHNDPRTRRKKGGPTFAEARAAQPRITQDEAKAGRRKRKELDILDAKEDIRKAKTKLAQQVAADKRLVKRLAKKALADRKQHRLEKKLRAKERFDKVRDVEHYTRNTYAIQKMIDARGDETEQALERQAEKLRDEDQAEEKAEEKRIEDEAIQQRIKDVRGETRKPSGRHRKDGTPVQRKPVKDKEISGEAKKSKRDIEDREYRSTGGDSDIPEKKLDPGRIYGADMLSHELEAQYYIDPENNEHMVLDCHKPLKNVRHELYCQLTANEVANGEMTPSEAYLECGYKGAVGKGEKNHIPIYASRLKARPMLKARIQYLKGVIESHCQMPDVTSAERIRMELLTNVRKNEHAVAALARAVDHNTSILDMVKETHLVAQDILDMDILDFQKQLLINLSYSRIRGDMKSANVALMMFGRCKGWLSTPERTKKGKTETAMRKRHMATIRRNIKLKPKVKQIADEQRRKQEAAFQRLHKGIDEFVDEAGIFPETEDDLGSNDS